MATLAHRLEVVVVAVLLVVVQMCDGEDDLSFRIFRRPPVPLNATVTARVEQIVPVMKSTFTAALATPPSPVPDSEADLLPIRRIFRSVKRHFNSPYGPGGTFG